MRYEKIEIYYKPSANNALTAMLLKSHCYVSSAIAIVFNLSSEKWTNQSWFWVAFVFEKQKKRKKFPKETFFFLHTHTYTVFNRFQKVKTIDFSSVYARINRYYIISYTRLLLVYILVYIYIWLTFKETKIAFMVFEHACVCWTMYICSMTNTRATIYVYEHILLLY